MWITTLSSQSSPKKNGKLLLDRNSPLLRSISKCGPWLIVSYLVSFQPCHPPWYVLNMLDPLLPQGLCSCCLLCLDSFYPRHLTTCLSPSLSFSSMVIFSKESPCHPCLILQHPPPQDSPYLMYCFLLPPDWLPFFLKCIMYCLSSPATR